jgi:putative peptidoglycan lipid II flippase
MTTASSRPQDVPPEAAAAAARPPQASGAPMVAAGILASRVFGYVRELGFAYFLGIGPYADVLRTALRAPNALQVLLGEGTLSASFIPVYSRFLAEGRREDAGRFAGAVFGLLLAVTAAVVVAGILLAHPLVAVLAPGFTGDAAAVAAGTATVDRFELAVRAVRIIFPMVGFMVLSVWALGVLNSHRRFFLAYFAPVLWNAAIVAALLLAAGGTGVPVGSAPERLERLLFAACAGALVGGALQFAVQLPLVARLLTGFRLSLSTRVEGVRQALRAFGPVVAGRGVVQVASFLDLILASLLAAGAVGALGPGQYLYWLPVSLFGMSVAAAELPELSRAGGGGEPPAAFLARVRRGVAQTSFLTLPTALGYLAFGFLLVGALFRRGRFGLEDTWLVYLVLCGYSLGLPATTASRLLQNSFYALHDTRTPALIAVVRVALAAAAALPLMFWLDRYPVAGLTGGAGGERLFLGAAGLALASAVGAWVELWRLRVALARRLAGFGLPWGQLAAMAGVAAAAALPAGLVWWLLPPLPPLVAAVAVLVPYVVLYLGGARLAGISEAAAWLGRLRRRRGKAG